MANYSYTNAGIKFNKITSDSKLAITPALYNGANNYQYAETDGIEPFINAVEIDWNSAILGEKTITEVGEACSVLPLGFAA